MWPLGRWIPRQGTLLAVHVKASNSDSSITAFLNTSITCLAGRGLIEPGGDNCVVISFVWTYGVWQRKQLKSMVQLNLFVI